MPLLAGNLSVDYISKSIFCNSDRGVEVAAMLDFIVLAHFALTAAIRTNPPFFARYVPY